MCSARKIHRGTTMAGAAMLLLSCGALQAQQFRQVNLVTDDSSANPATLVDPKLVNPWGVSFSGTSPFWISDNGSGFSTLYRVNPLTDVPTKVALEVKIPGAGNTTGQAFNQQGAGAFNGDTFLFVSEDGTVSGWRGALGTTAETLAVASPANNYKGSAYALQGGHSYLFAANFRSGAVDVFKGDAGAPDLAGKFADPGLPSGYAPFNVRNLGGKLYVTYAKQDSTGTEDVAGAGNGFVSVFDLQGNFIGRVGSQGALNSPWGLELAPASFGAFAGDLLVGNFGDGTINVFDPAGGGFLGQLSGENGAPLVIDGLWAITTGNNGGAGSSGKLYFTAGPDDEAHGLFGLVKLVPDSGSAAFLLLLSLAGLAINSNGLAARNQNSAP